MRAVVVSEFGGPQQLRLERVADPVTGPGQVRIAVHAARVNPVDAGNRSDGCWAGLDVPDGRRRGRRGRPVTRRIAAALKRRASDAIYAALVADTQQAAAGPLSGPAGHWPSEEAPIR